MHESLSREYIELKKTLNKEACSKTEERIRIDCLNRANNKINMGEKYKLVEPWDNTRQYYFNLLKK